MQIVPLILVKANMKKRKVKDDNCTSISSEREKDMGKIRVEDMYLYLTKQHTKSKLIILSHLKKLWIIPRQMLKSTNSLRGSMYVQAGAEYVRCVSSLVKSGINSLKFVSFSLTFEGLFPFWKALRDSFKANHA